MTILDITSGPLAQFECPNISHIPGPRTLPFIGNTISFALNPYGAYFNRLARFGDVFRMTVFGETWAVLAGPDALEHIYLNRDDIFSAQNGLRAFAPIFSGGFCTVTVWTTEPTAASCKLRSARHC